MAADFTVTSVNQSQEIGSTGNLVDVVIITFELAGAAGSGEVRVPLADDWQAAAEAALREKTAAMLALLAL